MNHQCEEAKLSAEEIAKIHRNMKARGLTHVYCQTCSEEMIPEQARKSTTGLIMCRPCYMCNETEATQEEIDQALEEEFPGYLASFEHRSALDGSDVFKTEISSVSSPPQKPTHPGVQQVNPNAITDRNPGSKPKQ
jgi:hypothetical protein